MFKKAVFVKTPGSIPAVKKSGDIAVTQLGFGEGEFMDDGGPATESDDSALPPFKPYDSPG